MTTTKSKYYLIAPFESGGEEPGEGEDDPPDGGGHAEEVDEEEDERAGHRPRRVVADDALVAGGLLVAERHPHQVAHAHHEVARAEEHDRPLGVLEALRVDQVRRHRHQRRDAAQRRPHRDPDRREVALLL